MVRVMAKTFSLDDLIEFEVNKRLGEKDEGGGEFGLSGLMKLLKMLIKLRELELKATTAIKPQAQPQTQTPQMQLNAENVVKSIEEAITMILNTYGDIQLSEVLNLLRQNRDAVKSIIEQKLSG